MTGTAVILILGEFPELRLVILQKLQTLTIQISTEMVYFIFHLW